MYVYSGASGSGGPGEDWTTEDHAVHGTGSMTSSASGQDGWEQLTALLQELDPIQAQPIRAAVADGSMDVSEATVFVNEFMQMVLWGSLLQMSAYGAVICSVLFVLYRVCCVSCVVSGVRCVQCSV